MQSSVAHTRRAATASMLLAVAAPLLTGCLIAAAGAGAGGAVYFTSRGAQSLVDASVTQVASAVDETYSEMGIDVTATSTENSGAEREVKGEQGDLDVTTHFEREETGSTRVEVTARKNVAEWDKDFAKRVLEKIIEKI